MKLVYRPIDFINDREYVLECHCRINYACDCPWARKIHYNDYRAEWFSMPLQISSFYDYLKESAEDSRTLAVIIETTDGLTIGYLWAPFCSDDESGFCFTDVQDIYIEPAFRNQGIAESLLAYAEQHAKTNGAKVIRSGTGCENTASIRLHEKCGFYQYRIEYEKLL